MAKKILGTKITKLGVVIRIECSRCLGTGWWSGIADGRVCFKCGGSGEVGQDTAEAAYNRKLAHIEEVKSELADNERRILTARFGKSQIQSRIDSQKANLAKLEAELATMKKA